MARRRQSLAAVGALVVLTAIPARAKATACPSLSVPPPSRWTDQIEDGTYTGIRELVLEADLDDDGRGDRLRAEDSAGSAMGLTALELSLSSRSEPIEIHYEFSFLGFVDRTPIPEALLSAGPCAISAAEEVLFRHPIRGEPDPSLQRLLGPEQPLRWIDGPPSLPETYTLRNLEEAVWVTYKGHNHGPAPADADQGFRELAREGDRVLLGTRHGVVLTDPARSRYAWIYVFPGGHKLRWPSVASASFHGEEAAVEIEFRDGSPRRHEVRIDLGPADR